MPEWFVETLPPQAVARHAEVDRTIVEFCCSNDSLIGQPEYLLDGCTVIRLTEKDEVTTEKGLQKAKLAVTQNRALLWASIPCTGGSPTWTVNVKKPGGPEKLAAHRKTFDKIWQSFEIVARECVNNGGKVAIEWPSHCTYWKLQKVQNLVKELQLQRFRVTGCAMGLRG